MTNGIPSLRFLFQTVDTASKIWQEDRESKKTGRVKQIFTNLCKNFNDHKALLSVIPSDDKYVCLLSGSLAAIAQVSISAAANELRRSY
jgi:hypothetical protein